MKFVNRLTLQLAMRELQALVTDRRIMSVFVLVIILFAISGPFGTLERFSLSGRLGYWLIIQAMTWFAALLTLALFNVTLGGTVRAPLQRIMLSALAMILPVSLALVLGNALLIGSGGTFLSDLGAAIASSAPLCVIFSLLNWLASGASGKGFTSVSAEEANRAQPDTAQILTRLPPEKRGKLLRLAALDHYVEVTTERGSTLLLMRLSDAIAECAPVEGLQVHRSHWVAKDAMAGRAEKNGKLLIISKDGHQIPVSRNHRQAAKAALSPLGL